MICCDDPHCNTICVIFWRFLGVIWGYLAVFLRLSVVISFALLLTISTPFNLTIAQEQCGIAQSISHPVDLNVFELGQDYGIASPRHQGRFHTGEDYFVTGRSTLGQPVAAAATGRVTFSSPRGWGRDGGVIIIEHTFPDGTVIYTQYGHIMESETVTFPPRLSCVEAGDVIAIIGESRPAPHLHFEVRVANPDVPGPGYSREAPGDAGWRRPSAVIMDMQARLNRGYRWSVTTGIATDPLVLDDNSLLVADGATVRRITPDGRILWRVIGDKSVAGVTGFQANPLLFYGDGTVGRVDFEGNAGERWQLEFAPNSVPLQVGEALVFHTANEQLVAVSADRREVLWALNDIPAYDVSQVSNNLIALATETEIRLISHAGALIDTVQIEDGVSLAASPDGDLLAYTRGGLWRIDATGTWSQAIDAEIPSESTGSRAVYAAEDGRIFLTNGTDLYAYSRLGTQVWGADLPQAVSGRVEIYQYDDLVLLLSNHGNIIVAREGGGFCGYTRIYGNDDDRLWHDLGDDGILRVIIGQQILGLAWEQFNAGC